MVVVALTLSHVHRRAMALMLHAMKIRQRLLSDPGSVKPVRCKVRATTDTLQYGTNYISLVNEIFCLETGCKNRWLVLNVFRGTSVIIVRITLFLDAWQ